MKLFGLFLLVLWLSIAGASSSKHKPTRAQTAGPQSQSCQALSPEQVLQPDFAAVFSLGDLNKPKRVTALLRQVMYWEGRFHQPAIGYNARSGLTYDGIPLDAASGRPSGQVRPFSAASKESLHISLLAKALDGNCLARIFLSPQRPDQAPQLATALLTEKITSLERFNQRYPGFGGYLPWFATTDKGAHPLKGWEQRAPSIDNGELAWAMMAAVQALRKTGNTKLVQRYQDWISLMAENAHRLFFDEATGLLRGEVFVPHPTRPPLLQSYSSPPGGYYLKDPYEGELFTLFWSLYGRSSQREVQKTWRTAQQPRFIEVRTKAGLVTVRQGWYFSAHEEWNLLQAPYLDHPFLRRIFLNNQRLRTHFARELAFPGLFASAHVPGASPLEYASNLGIPVAASQADARTDIAVPYATFPVILLDPQVGLAWYLAILQQPRMQTALGVNESISIAKRQVAAIATWDAKMTTVLALLGGTGDLAKAYLQDTDRASQFFSLLQQSYARGLQGKLLQGESLPLALPPTRRP